MVLPTTAPTVPPLKHSKYHLISITWNQMILGVTLENVDKSSQRQVGDQKRSTQLINDPNSMIIPDNFNIPSKSQGKTWTKQKTELSSTLLSGASFYKVYCQSAGVQQLALGESIKDFISKLPIFDTLNPLVYFFITY